MAEPQERMAEEALWRRWRSAAGPDAALSAELDPLLVAAYAEGRVDDTERDLVEEWLTADPALVGDVLAARNTAESAVPAAPPSLLARAMALVNAGDAQIFAFRRPAPRWRAVAAWGGMAASLVVTGFLGFNLGTDAYLNLTGTAPTAMSQELLDPPAGLFNNSADEDSAI
jgi:hypothetical protein